MLTRVADELRRGVETHRLTVQQSAGEDRGMMALQPGRDIDQPREARRMAFGETIAAEAFDLGEASLREPRLVAASQHARDESLTECANGSHPLEGCERPAQPVGLGRRETGRNHRDLHRLFLEEGNAIGAPQHFHHGGAEVFDLLLALTAVDEGMNHAALDRAGADDRDLADQIVKFPRLHARQEVELGPAFDLEDPDRIGLAEHVIDHRILGRNISEGQLQVAVILQQPEGLADAGQHAERQDIDLQQPERIDIVLVPFDDGAILHRGVLDRTELVEPAMGDDKAANMLAQMPGKPDDLTDQLRRQRHAPVRRIDPGVAHPVLARGAGRPAPDLTREPGDHVLAQPHHLADLADRGA